MKMRANVGKKDSTRNEVHYHETNSKTSPYGAYYYTKKLLSNGKQKWVAVRKKFDQPEKRDQWAAEIRRTLVESGKSSKALDPARLRRWEIAEAMIGGADPVEVASFWLQNSGNSASSLSRRVLVSKILSDYIEDRKKDTAFEPNQYRAHFDRFNRAFGSLHAFELANHSIPISNWLEGLPFAPSTKRNQYTRVNAAFSWAVRMGIIPSHPFARIKAPSAKIDEVEGLSLEEVRQLFRANISDKALCAKLALSLFGGMRSSAVARLEWRDIKFDIPAIETPAWKTKRNRRLLIEGLPENLWPWIKRASASDFAVPCSNHRSLPHRKAWKDDRRNAWMHQKSRALQAAGLLIPATKVNLDKGIVAKAPPRNWARHTFVTNHVAAYGDLALTATLVSHSKSVEVLREHYLGVETKARSLEFFEITPDKL